MKSIPTTPHPDKVILLHNGALGDFLMAWPSAWALRRAMPRAELFFAGPGERLRWLAPLGFSPCPPAQRVALERLYAAATWPGELEGFACIWFVVDRLPDVPASGDLAFLKAVSGQSPVRHARDEYADFLSNAGGGGRTVRHARDEYARALSGLGVPTPDGWLADFRRLFASSRRAGNNVLLFPGAGHPLKQWPLVQYFQLADLIEARGLRPVFVLGPAEMERGIVPRGRETAAPQSLEELERLLLSARFAVGGDTGPMHLAGMLGVPGVSLFGPTSFAQWGPAGMAELSLRLPCSPCTATCADLACESPRCLEDITPETVLEKLKTLDLESKIGFQGPGIP